MRSPKYALEPLARLRKQKVDAAVEGLARAVTERDGAERRRRQTEQERDTHEAVASGVRSGEREALERGQLRAADLAHAGAWELRVKAEREAMAAKLDKARTLEGVAREEEQRARSEVATRQADAKVVDRDRDRWEQGLRKRADAKEEEAMAEAYRPRR